MRLCRAIRFWRVYPNHDDHSDGGEGGRVPGILAPRPRFEGYGCVTAGGGRGALTAPRGPPPDLVVLDVMLPGLDGLEVARRLRGGSDVPIIMLTARDAVP